MGPTVGGFLVENFGFTKVAFLYVIFFIFATFVDVAGVICQTHRAVGYERVNE